VARALAADPPVLLMDEPFGAIDPITRTRLQSEFLKLQAELRKTVVIVTHDIEEAVHLGDRIALLAEGGHLAQYDTPAQLLGAPASPFVAEFVGADRGLKRLSVTPLSPGDVEQPPTFTSETSAPAAAAALTATGSRFGVVLYSSGRVLGWVDAGALAGLTGTVMDVVAPSTSHVQMGCTLKDAFVEILQQDDGRVAVLDGDQYVGVLTPDSVHAALRHSIEQSP
jgi:osmoprotectant transport system ATP-binding protein